MLEDRRLTVREIAAEVGINIGSAKFVPKLLTEEQKEFWKEVCEDMLDCASCDPEFMRTIITGDETWVYGYDPEAKFQSSQWKHPESPHPKKAW